MSDLLQQQITAMANWSAQAMQQAWLDKHDASVIDEITLAAPDILFDQIERPLVAGLFGGTGVGKSSLLNRLAGEPIARTSAERPTSRHITVYVHRSISVNRLPDGFPMDRMRTALHSNDRFRQVMFVDMPDFDSVDTSNRDLVNLWLPHLDVVLYVVSPERYRDDQGWRLLQQHAAQHAWMFIFNHWDRAVAEQWEDFSKQLKTAGLPDPKIFKTDCSQQLPDNSSSNDDFQLFQSELIALSEQTIVQALQEHGVVSRLQSLKTAGDTCLAKVADQTRCEAMLSQWQQHCEQARVPGKDSLRWAFSQVSRSFASPATTWWRAVFTQPNPPDTATTSARKALQEAASALAEQLDRQLEHFINQQAHSQPMPTNAVKNEVATPYAAARQSIASTLNVEMEHSLATPGNRWQRALHRCMSLLGMILPIGAMTWIAWRVVNGFIAGASDTSAYLGTNFAVNSALLIGLAWLMPAFVKGKCQPSNQTAALRGLYRGYEQVCDDSQAAVEKGLTTMSTKAKLLRQQYTSMWTQVPESISDQLPDAVRQLIFRQIDPTQSLSRGLDVRANTHNSTDIAPVS